MRKIVVYYRFFIHVAISATTSSATCPSTEYSAFVGTPVPVMNKWFNVG
jgi:hypothetical protein